MNIDIPRSHLLTSEILKNFKRKAEELTREVIARKYAEFDHFEPLFLWSILAADSLV